MCTVVFPTSKEPLIKLCSKWSLYNMSCSHCYCDALIRQVCISIHLKFYLSHPPHTHTHTLPFSNPNLDTVLSYNVLIMSIFQLKILDNVLPNHSSLILVSMQFHFKIIEVFSFFCTSADREYRRNTCSLLTHIFSLNDV